MIQYVFMEKESKHLLEEQELIVGQAPNWTRYIFAAFPPFRHYSYRLFFAGQFVSLIGSWIHMVALGWLVLEMTNSAFWVSIVASLDTLPILLFSLFAGLLADRVKRRRLLVWTQIAAMLIVFMLGLLVQLHIVNLAIVLLLTFLLGTAFSFEMPTRQTLIFDVVGKKDIHSAVALNVVMFNSARIIGPALAGLLIAVVNIQTAFFLNAASYIAIILALRKMKLKKFVHGVVRQHPFMELKEGLRFAFRNPVIQTLLFVVAFNSLIPWAFGHIMPVVAKRVFLTDSLGYGVLLSAAGVGALVGAFFVSLFSDRIPVGRTIGILSFISAITLILFSMTHIFLVGFLLLMVMGVSLFTQVTLCNATIQKAAPDHMRGRVISVYTLMFLGTMPLGGFLIGMLSSIFDVQIAIRILGFTTLAGSAFYILFLQRRIKELQAT